MMRLFFNIIYLFILFSCRKERCVGMLSICNLLFKDFLSQTYSDQTDRMVPPYSGKYAAQAANHSPAFECSPFADLAVSSPLDGSQYATLAAVDCSSSGEVSRPASTASSQFLELTLPVVDLNFCDLLPYEGKKWILLILR